eukprot:TRINITY_DN2750_c0_g1_i7.p1 TRINITY_DN2750_c0_g1~~TRINITY_DN2750_c0_g1_i7.p1  ORF type:complete len:1298 (+),score=332.79 TRINITY_DN2750_c0_g1_i7:65-3895(+)
MNQRYIYLVLTVLIVVMFISFQQYLISPINHYTPDDSKGIPLQYWKPFKYRPSEKSVDNKYMLFTPRGNDIATTHATLEIAFVLSIITERTLVLPDISKSDPVIQNFWSVSDMKKCWNVISYEEFVKLDGYENIMKSWFSIEWSLTRNSILPFPENPTKFSVAYNKMLKWSGFESINLISMDQITKNNDKRVLSFNPIVETTFDKLFYPTSHPKLTLQSITELVKNNVHFEEKYFELASDFLEKIPQPFSVVHCSSKDIDNEDSLNRKYDKIKEEVSDDNVFILSDKKATIKASSLELFLEKKLNTFTIDSKKFSGSSKRDTSYIVQLIVSSRSRVFVSTQNDIAFSSVSNLRSFYGRLNVSIHLIDYIKKKNPAPPTESPHEKTPRSSQTNKPLIPPAREQTHQSDRSPNPLSLILREEDRSFFKINDLPFDSDPPKSIEADKLKDCKEELERIKYWDRPDVNKKPLPIIPNRFFTWKIMHSGFNNRRMTLEIAYVFAYVTNRTFVLHPPHHLVPFNELGTIEKFWDLDGMKSGWPTITWEEFKKLPNYEDLMKDTVVLPWKDFTSSESVLFIPNEPHKGDEDWENYVKWRLPKNPESPGWGTFYNFSSAEGFEEASNLYFDAEGFQHYYASFYPRPYSGITFENILRLVRDHLHYREDISAFSAYILTKLPKHYSSIHYRRGDLDYETAKRKPEEIFVNTLNLFAEGEDIYIATDDNPEKFKQFESVFALRYKLHRYGDYEEYAQGIDPKWVPLIEKQIAGQGRLFVGTLYSTFTSYIHKIRGWMPSVENKNFYYTNRRYFTVEDHQEYGHLAWERDHHNGFVAIMGDMPIAPKIDVKLIEKPDSSPYPKSVKDVPPPDTVASKTLKVELTIEEERKFQGLPIDSGLIPEINEKDMDGLSDYVSKLTYWNTASSNTKKLKKYLIYESKGKDADARRMELETAFVMAYLSNRVLVLPPPHLLAPFPSVGYEELIWDIEGMKQGWPTISWKEFKKLDNYESIKNNVKELNWDDLTSANSAIVFPKVPSKSSESEYKKFVEWRKPLGASAEKGGKFHDFSDISNYDSDVLSIKSDISTLFYTLFYISSNTQDKSMKSMNELVKDHLHVRSEIIPFAARILSQLPDSFSTIHWQKKDNNHSSASQSPEEMFVNTYKLFKDGEQIYLSTDGNKTEVEKFVSAFSTRYRVHKLETFKYLLNGVDDKWYPVIEQLICAQGRVFVGSLRSMFTGYIQRLRGYQNQSNKNFYFLHNRYGDVDDQQNVSDYSLDREYPKAFNNL